MNDLAHEICTALEALGTSLPGSTYLTCSRDPGPEPSFRASVCIQVTSDEHVVALAARLGLPDPDRRRGGGAWWLGAEGTRDGLLLGVFGPHHKEPIVERLDDRRLSAACARVAQICGAP